MHLGLSAVLWITRQLYWLVESDNEDEDDDDDSCQFNGKSNPLNDFFLFSNEFGLHWKKLVEHIIGMGLLDRTSCRTRTVEVRLRR